MRLFPHIDFAHIPQILIPKFIITVPIQKVKIAYFLNSQNCNTTYIFNNIFIIPKEDIHKR